MGLFTNTEGGNPLIHNNFVLRVNAIYDLPCRRISGISDRKNFKEITAGGINDFVYLREAQTTEKKSFQVERYITGNYFDPLTLGKNLLLPIVLYVSRQADGFDQATQIFTFWGCTVLSKSYSDMDAEHSGLLVETTEIAYQRMNRTTKSEEETDNSAEWSFDVTGKQYEGIGKRHAVYDRQEVRKSKMEENSRIWPTVRSARTLKNFRGE